MEQKKPEKKNRRFQSSDSIEVLGYRSVSDEASFEGGPEGEERGDSNSLELDEDYRNYLADFDDSELETLSEAERGTGESEKSDGGAGVSGEAVEFGSPAATTERPVEEGVVVESDNLGGNERGEGLALQSERPVEEGVVVESDNSGGNERGEGLALRVVKEFEIEEERIESLAIRISKIFHFTVRKGEISYSYNSLFKDYKRFHWSMFYLSLTFFLLYVGLSFYGWNYIFWYLFLGSLGLWAFIYIFLSEEIVFSFKERRVLLPSKYWDWELDEIQIVGTKTRRFPPVYLINFILRDRKGATLKLHTSVERVKNPINFSEIVQVLKELADIFKIKFRTDSYGYLLSPSLIEDPFERRLIEEILLDSNNNLYWYRDGVFLVGLERRWGLAPALYTGLLFISFIGGISVIINLLLFYLGSPYASFLVLFSMPSIYLLDITFRGEIFFMEKLAFDTVRGEIFYLPVRVFNLEKGCKVFNFRDALLIYTTGALIRTGKTSHKWFYRSVFVLPEDPLKRMKALRGRKKFKKKKKSREWYSLILLESMSISNANLFGEALSKVFGIPHIPGEPRRINYVDIEKYIELRRNKQLPQNRKELMEKVKRKSPPLLSYPNLVLLFLLLLIILIIYLWN